MSKNIKIEVQGKEITIIKNNDINYVSLTQIVDSYNGGNGNGTIDRWLSNKNTLEFLGAWEALENKDFNYPEFGVIKNEAGVNRFYMSAKKWIEKTKAIGIQARAGRYGGTFAHEDIAMEFCTWLDPVFKLAVIKEFKRLRTNEAKQIGGQWDVRRFVSKVNFKLQTDAVKEVLVPLRNLPKEKEGILYAEASDLIYLAMFGYTSKQWREENPKLAAKGLNIRDLANSHQLIILANLETLDSVLIKAGITDKYDRLTNLRREAIAQMKSFSTSNEIDHKLVESPHLAEQKLIADTDRVPKQSPNLNKGNNEPD